MLCSIKSLGVSLKALAASGAFEESCHKIDAQPSGLITENQVFSNINILSHNPIPKAPPLAPSPITIDNIGVSIDAISIRLFAIAYPCPLSSAATPGSAPGVSIKVITGKSNFSAIFIIRNAFL